MHDRFLLVANHLLYQKIYLISAGRVPLFNAPLLPAPPLPPENIVTEQDRQTQIHYEQWLNHQNQIVTSQLKYYETEVSKLRKIRKVSSPKSLYYGNSKEFTMFS
jgi:histone-lysine N-methyltransferase MLL3